MAAQAVRPINVGATYKNQTIQVDGQQFVECVFEKCTLEFAGEALPYFERCTLVDARWSFVGAAGITIGFLQMVRNTFGEGGKDFVEIVFEFIRDNDLVPGMPEHAGVMVRSIEQPKRLSPVDTSLSRQQHDAER